MTAIAAPEQGNFFTGTYNVRSGTASSQFLENFSFLTKRQSHSNWQYRFDHTRYEAIVQLIQIYKDCCEDNWDGYGSLAITPAVFFEALRFIRDMPQGLPSPDIGPEPAGDIGFEWNYGKNRIFVASVSGTNYVTYAGLFGPGVKAHGTEVFNDSIAQMLIEKISRISQVQ